MPAHDIEVTTTLDAETVTTIDELITAVSTQRRHRALGERKAFHVKAGVDDGAISILARDRQHALVGYSQLLTIHQPWGLEAVVPAGPGHDALTRQLLAAAREEVARRGGAEVHYWVFKPTDDEVELARDLGFTEHRDLLQLRVPLPLQAAMVDETRAVTLRSFQVGHDETRWLAVNNRAFAGHPEQGQMEAATLAKLERAPWFDPDGFLVLEEDGVILGSCWTKIHREPGGDLGEIYVISTDPAAQGRGLGRVLTIRGLDWLARQGVSTGMLYVDADNHRAVALYSSLGFMLDHVDRSFIAHVEGASA